MKHIYHPLFPEVIIFTPNIFFDERGYFMESYNQYIKNILNIDFLQENHSKSNKNVFRGLHFQWNKPMSKLLRVVNGNGIGVIVDIRKSSLTYKKHTLIELNSTDHNILFTPSGFAQGFLSLEDNTHLCYKCSSVRNETYEGVIDPFDSELGITLKIKKENVILSQKDKLGNLFSIYDSNPKFI